MTASRSLAPKPIPKLILGTSQAYLGKGDLTMPNQGKICFIIAPIGEEGSDIRQRSDQILKHIITPAAKECGFEPIRADQISEPGIITSQIIQHLLDDPLVIADLTGHNPNVFYELAIRHAIRKPCIQLIRKGEKIPFDIAQSRSIQLDHTDLDSVVNCKDEMIKQIRSLQNNPFDIDTPISVAIDIKFLRQSDNPLEKSSAEILSALQNLANKIDNIPFIYQPIIAHHIYNKIISNMAKMYEILDEVDRSEKDSINRDKLKDVIYLLNNLEIVVDDLASASGYSTDYREKYKKK